jgi:hypothetical protein
MLPEIYQSLGSLCGSGDYHIHGIPPFVVIHSVHRYAFSWCTMGGDRRHTPVSRMPSFYFALVTETFTLSKFSTWGTEMPIWTSSLYAAWFNDRGNSAS